MTVDNRPEFVDKSRAVVDAQIRALDTSRHQSTIDDSTGLVGSRGRGSPPASGPLETLRSPSVISEELLLRGYGVSRDLETELLERPIS